MFSYHNHSDLSDGHASAEEQIVSAYNHGIREFGLSDHFCIMPEGSSCNYGMKDIDRYIRTLKKLKECYAHKINIKFGVELENIPETMREAEEILRNYPLDYIIGGTHFAGDMPVDLSKDLWTSLTEDERHRKILNYWEAEYDMCRNADIDIVAHFDLYEKWGPLVQNDYSEYFRECLKACKERGLATEINTAKKKPGVDAFYPNENFLKILAEYDIPVIISADAHYPVHVTREFETAKKLFRKYGIKHTARFDRRQIKTETAEF
ncbi:MAG: histidinol-phosphatase HisJ family protein [Armatimonadetes bacterium]|nr:histidinol-phosphatase HisJ family protein [Candidatus Hippobium faecium]